MFHDRGTVYVLVSALSQYCCITPTGLEHVKYDTFGYYEWNGIPLTHKQQPPEKVKLVPTFDDFRPDDVFLSTFPKSGKSTCYLGALGLGVLQGHIAL